MKKALALAVSMLLFDCAMALAQRTSVSRDFPIYDNQGKPDLTPDPKRFVSQMEIVDRLFQAGDCELVEGSVGGTVTDGSCASTRYSSTRAMAT